MRQSKIPLFKVRMATDAHEYVKDVFDSGYIGQGHVHDTFEAKLAERFQRDVSLVNSATSGLHLALHMIKAYANEPERNEVLTTPLTCTATNWPIMANGLRPRWVDVDPATCNIDYGDLARKVNEKTLAIMLVHWGGTPACVEKLGALRDQCRRQFGYAPVVIEDCAHAFGASVNQGLLGMQASNYYVFSFQAIKHLTTGDGGLLICPNQVLDAQAKKLRWYGMDRTQSAAMRCQQNVQDWGYKFNMNDISAAIGLANLADVDSIVARHQSNGQFYDAQLKGLTGLIRQTQQWDHLSAYWFYTLRVSDRENFIRMLAEEGIAAGQVHTRNDTHKCVSQYRAILPALDVVNDDMVCIPCGWWVTDGDREFIVDKIKEGW